MTRRALAALAITLGLVVAAAAPATANSNVKPTAPVFVLGPYYGWPEWCGLVGWRIDSNGISMQVQVIVGSVTGSGGGACQYSSPIAAADMDGTLIIRTGGLITCYAFATTQNATPNYWVGGNGACAPYVGWNTVQVVAHWGIRVNGAQLTYTSPEFPVYIT